MIGPAGFMAGPKTEAKSPMLVTLVPQTAKHKQKVRRWGNMWRVIDHRHFVSCLNEAGMLVCPCDDQPATTEHPHAFWMPAKYVKTSSP